MTDLYYEAHITIEPVFDEDLEEVKELVKPFGFRVADLLMKKNRAATPERSEYDTFCTARSTDYVAIYTSTIGCVEALQEAGFGVWRYKIEDTLLDVHLKAPQELLFRMTPARAKVIAELAKKGTPVRVDPKRAL